MNKKPYCRKCLLDQLNEDDVIRSVKDYIAEYPMDKRCSSEVYSRRLEICSNCSQLSNGMCALCGCFVEVRALKIKTYCPDHIDKWSQEHI